MLSKQKNNMLGKCQKLNNQRGVVLIVALVFLVALTAVAVALMQNTTSDVRMSAASEEKVIATQKALSASDEVIADQVTAGVGENSFAKPLKNNFPIEGLEANLTGDLKIDTLAKIDIANNEYKLESDCPHRKGASATTIFSCNVLSVNVTTKYGRKNAQGNKVNEVVVVSGVAQELLK